MRRPLLLAAVCLILGLGFLLQLGIFDRVPAGQIDAEAFAAGEPLTLTGQVYQKDSEKYYIQSVHIVQSAVDPRQTIPCKDNLICVVGKDANIPPLGSAVLITGSFQPFSAATNPGEFDSLEYYRTLGLGGRMKDCVLLAQGENFWHVREALYRFRCLLKMRLETIFPQQEAAVMCALLLGDKGDLDPDLKELYQRNGILHILSISSLHITMIGMTVYKLLRRCRVPVRPSAAVGCVLLFIYGMMTGFSVSACRAIGMYLLRMTAEMIGRTYDMPTAMGVVAAFLVVRNPYYLRNAGFLLSFSSMIGIGAVYPAFRADDKRKKLRIKLAEPVISGISITLATLPVQLWFYYQVPIYSVLLNILVLPLMKILMAAGFLSLIPPLGFCGRIDWLILKGYEWLCNLFDNLPYHTWNPGKPQLWQVVFYYLILAAVLWLRKLIKENRKKRRESRDSKAGQGVALRICAAGVYGALILDIFIVGWHPPLKNQLLFLDVGQGDGILVRTASGENYLFDCGSSSRSRLGRYVLLPCLRYYGIQTLDAVILSHPDADHVNGFLELLSMGRECGIEVKQLVLPEISETGKFEMMSQLTAFMPEGNWNWEIPISFLSAGESWQCDRAEFVCLQPEKGSQLTDSNAYSICVYGIFLQNNGEKEFDFLLTGDVEGAGEAALLAELESRGIQNISVLKVAHHGSKNSTVKGLLEQLSPALSVISCGKNNRYGHPHEELLKRLIEADSKTIVTSESGAIMVYYDKKQIIILTRSGSPHLSYRSDGRF